MCASELVVVALQPVLWKVADWQINLCHTPCRPGFGASVNTVEAWTLAIMCCVACWLENVIGTVQAAANHACL